MEADRGPSLDRGRLHLAVGRREGVAGRHRRRLSGTAMSADAVFLDSAGEQCRHQCRSHESRRAVARSGPPRTWVAAGIRFTASGSHRIAIRHPERCGSCG